MQQKAADRRYFRHTDTHSHIHTYTQAEVCMMYSLGCCCYYVMTQKCNYVNKVAL